MSFAGKRRHHESTVRRGGTGRGDRRKPPCQARVLAGVGKGARYRSPGWAGPDAVRRIGSYAMSALAGGGGCAARRTWLYRGGPGAGDRTVIPVDRAGSPAAVLHRPLVHDDGGAGHRGAVGEQSAHRHRDVAGRRTGREGPLVASAPVLLTGGLGPGPGRTCPGPCGRGSLRASESRRPSLATCATNSSARRASSWLPTPSVNGPWISGTVLSRTRSGLTAVSRESSQVSSISGTMPARITTSAAGVSSSKCFHGRLRPVAAADLILPPQCEQGGKGAGCEESGISRCLHRPHTVMSQPVHWRKTVLSTTPPATWSVPGIERPSPLALAHPWAPQDPHSLAIVSNLGSW